MSTQTLTVSDTRVVAVGWKAPPAPLPLDEELYSLIDEEALQFMRDETGIQDEAELRQHILKVQAEAYAVFPYPCIRRFNFITLKVARTPGYDQLLQLGKQRANPIFLDIGCCFGDNVRKAAADGYPTKSIITSDLNAEFWTLGHKLFNSTHASFPAAFLAGDAFDDAHLAKAGPFYTAPPGPGPDLHALTSLNALHGRVSAIHAAALFHLFDERAQTDLALRLAGLLSPEPGSLIFGSHGGRPVAGLCAPERALHGFRMFCHSAESWAALWDGGVFERGTVRVEARVVEIPAEMNPVPVESGTRLWWLLWAVTRL